MRLRIIFWMTGLVIMMWMLKCKRPDNNRSQYLATRNEFGSELAVAVDADVDSQGWEKQRGLINCWLCVCAPGLGHCSQLVWNKLLDPITSKVR